MFIILLSSYLGKVIACLMYILPFFLLYKSTDYLSHYIPIGIIGLFLTNRLVPDQARQNVEPGLEPYCFDTLQYISHCIYIHVMQVILSGLTLFNTYHLV